jgi:phosphatidate cytidylyltransferase
VSLTAATGGVLLVIGALLGLGLIAVLLFALLRRSSTSGLTPRTAAARYASYAALALVASIAAATGVVGMALFALSLCLLGLREFVALTDLPVHHRIALSGAAVVVIIGAALMGPAVAEYLLPLLIAVGLAWPVLRPDPARGLRDLALAAIACIYLPVLLAHLPAAELRYPGVGGALIIAVAVATNLSDIGAFLIGKRFGRTKLAPTLSPNKTRAGVIGNLLGAAVGLALFSPALSPALPGGPLTLLLLVPVIAFGSLYGDLFESAIKREVGVKDAGTWLPGFGGILDRIDSLLITVPAAYWLLRIVEAIGA